MRVTLPDNCKNSPRAELAMKIAVDIIGNDYDALEPLLSDDFEWVTPGGDSKTTKKKMEEYMRKARTSNVTVDEFSVFTSLSHGKFAAVTSFAKMSNGIAFHSHDLYEFTSAAASGRLRRVTSYIVDWRGVEGA